MHSPEEPVNQQDISDIVDRFHDLGQQIRTARTERDALRQRLLHRAREVGENRLAGGRARVLIKQINIPRLPQTGSAERDRLEARVNAAGRWRAVSHLSAAKLGAALANDLFTPDDQADIQAQMPALQTTRITSRALKPCPPGNPAIRNPDRNPDQQPRKDQDPAQRRGPGATHQI